MTEALEPAFPRDHRYQGHNGMSLRDYFAGQALTGMFRHIGWINTIDDDQVEVARRAYAISDAMLAARKEQHATA